MAETRSSPADVGRAPRPGNAPVPPGLTGAVRSDWADLGAPSGAPARFDAGMTDALPEPVRRWLTHAIAPGTPLLTSVELASTGQIRLGDWRGFAAVQRVSAARGFVWAATTRMMGLPVAGYDRYSRYTGEMRWRILGAVPVRSAAGLDVTRSAAGRHAGEVLVALPAAALSPQVKWRPVDADRATARIKVGRGFHDVTLAVAAGGALTSITLSRWGAVGRGSFAERVFGADLGTEATFDGFTIPGVVTAGWDHGTAGWEDGQFIRYTVDGARYR
jgi:uncharacterized protein DUF6544